MKTIISFVTAVILVAVMGIFVSFRASSPEMAQLNSVEKTDADSLTGKIIRRFGNIIKTELQPGAVTPKVDDYVQLYGYIDKDLPGNAKAGWYYLGKAKILKIDKNAYDFTMEAEEPIQLTTSTHPSYITNLPLKIYWNY